jgi:hypothetical protein
VLPFDSSMNILLMNRLFSAAPMVFTCDGFYGRDTQPCALYSRRPVNVKVSERGDQGRQRTILKLCPMTPRRYRYVEGAGRFCETMTGDAKSSGRVVIGRAQIFSCG